MNKIISVLTLSTLLLLGGCKPEAPNDETKEKNHQDTHKVTVVFTPGKMEGNKFVPVSSLGKTLSFTASAESAWKPDNTIQPIQGVSYFVQVKHYSKAGEELNREYATNGEDLIHQHFFIPNKIKSEKALEWISYQYLDTKPWDAPISTDAEVIGTKNPIGLKGVMVFKQAGRELQIWLRLLHARGSKFSSANVASPFYAPGMWTANGAYDLDLNFDVEVLPNN